MMKTTKYDLRKAKKTKVQLFVDESSQNTGLKFSI